MLAFFCLDITGYVKKYMSILSHNQQVDREVDKVSQYEK